MRDAPVSTFSLDVDTASYAFVRASLNRNVLPQPAAVRTEELVNYFPYAYEAPVTPAEPFRTTVAVFPSPWAEGRKILHLGIKGYAVPANAQVIRHMRHGSSPRLMALQPIRLPNPGES